MNTEHDFSTLDALTPHPVYAWMGWVQILSPMASIYAVLLALVGVLLAIAAFHDTWLPALLLAVVSKVSFLALFAMTRPHGAPMRRVAIADVAALAVLALVVALRRC
ncbi:MAG: hypothetical protein KGO50_00195 [Myxococcales bacterium]|nr:hypothetical protein [Myxococcales bacterium]